MLEIGGIRLFDVHEIASKLECGAGFVRALIADDELKKTKIGRKFYVSEAVLVAWIERSASYRSADSVARTTGQRRGKPALKPVKAAC